MDVAHERLIPKEHGRLKSLEKAASDPYLTPTKPLIQRATQILHVKNDFDQYFQPIFVAFGPLHHPRDDDSRLYRAESSKLQLAAKFIKGSGRTNEDFYNNVKEHLSSLKKCYEQKELDKWKENWDDDDLAWMFLVDGCAVLYLAHLDVNHYWEKVGCKNIDLVAFAKLDMFLLENQLPFQLLQLLMSLCTWVPHRELDGKDEGGDSSHTDNGKAPEQVLMDSLKCFVHMNAMSLDPQHISISISDDRMPKSQTRQHDQQQEEEEPAHLLELLRRELIGDKLRKQGEKQQRVKKSGGFWGIVKKCCSRKNKQTFRSVTEMKEKGIFFRRSKKGRVTDIEFSDRYCMATLKLPPIVVDDSTIPKLLNLIAYEMCPDFVNDYEITTYVVFLDSLIDKAEDVKELRVAGVLHNGLGSDEAVAEMFNRMSDNLVPNPELKYSDLQERIQVHCNSLWASDLAQLYHTYFKSPWSFLVFIGVLAGLLLTGLQTYKEFNTNPAIK
ncbi:hypothetical protein SLEP1_g48409 [Rubroshorea leprosula]|uniref:Uncharacterized protein n=1 Tax=Rubroshorea leprosula TaxID=152421 RepID=A0AAV5LTI9_9ROSI|nr:hypothetical protein SLEP1_g48409 [Rubroshorea leprosula]